MSRRGKPRSAIFIAAILAATALSCAATPEPAEVAPATGPATGLTEAAPAAREDSGLVEEMGDEVLPDLPALPLLEKPAGWVSPVEKHGRLSVKGTQLVDSGGKPVILRGVSTSNLAVFEQFVAEDAIAELAYGWKVDVLRLAVWTFGINGGYSSNPRIGEVAIEAARLCGQYGIYCIIDWHILNDGDPLDTLDKAMEFFGIASGTFKDDVHVIYEICNEPHGEAVTWKGSIRPFAEKVIPVIRRDSPDSIVIVGTPNWSLEPDKAIEAPLALENVMYTVHYYAGNAEEWVMDRVGLALAKGLPIFCTEWGGTNSDGGKDGEVYPEGSRKWIDFLESKGLSWCIWQFSDAMGESSALIDIEAPAEGKRYSERLSRWGKLMYAELRKVR